jgi:hypothetical protein
MLLSKENKKKNVCELFDFYLYFLLMLAGAQEP